MAAKCSTPQGDWIQYAKKPVPNRDSVPKNGTELCQNESLKRELK